MEETTWEERHQAIIHLLTNPTTKPTLHSQFFIATQIPCYLNWDYPPILCNKQKFPSLYLHWGFSLFIKRVFKLGYSEISWRSKCPFQQPPPLILAKGVEKVPERLGDEERRKYARKRLRRKRFGNHVNPLIPFLVPNLLLLSLLYWDPFPGEDF
ncbi:hypothetical protein AQUCO_05100025v1 [Aquilegia coerulea]|uniref:Transmembrane protein n=1 Tax=Aquilegia coerulea TaxID=218851 RepID=A0A2G5CIW3_AQUCA|nr:hypothetical protein AQUCO_05100025v1 [Aquilegia coerulea]